MAHIDYDAVTSLDALIAISDAAARAAMMRLRERLDRLDAGLDPRLIVDSLHKKPVIAFYRGEEPVLHIFPEPNVATGLHVAVPIRTIERKLMRFDDLPDWLQEAVVRSRPRHNVIWVDTILHTPGRVDAIVDLLQRKIDLTPTVH